MKQSVDELLATVVSDLRYIRDEWKEDISDDALRRGSGVLRRLVVHNDLQRAWKIARFEREPTIPCSVLPDMPPEQLEFASAGGASCNGAVVQSVIAPRGGFPPHLMSVLARRMQAGMLTDVVPLSKFASATCIVIDGVEIPRRVVIKYVSNKLGGSHFDLKRNDTEGALFRALDRTREVWKVAEKPVMYFELLAIGQCLAASADLERLAASVRPE